MKKNSLKMLIIDCIIFILLVILDQYTKILLTAIKGGNSIPLINNVLEFRYLENHGAAFGILQGQRVFFLIMSIVVFLVIGLILYRIPNEKKYLALNLILTFILAGAIGNTIDRLVLGYVRDFIYFSLIDFPIFNVADIYITCSTILLIIVIIFFYKEDDLKFLSFKSEKDS